MCNIWHVNIEALPDWITGEIEEAQWTIGKLSCLYCGARLGGFNFVSNVKCPCGQDVTVHLCKSRTDYEPAQSIRIVRPSKKKLALLHEMHPEVTAGEITENRLRTSMPNSKNVRCSRMVNYSREVSRLTEALCLEVRSGSKGFGISSSGLHFKADNSKILPSASQTQNTSCTVKTFHRKSHSLDCSNKGSFGTVPIPENCCSPSHLSGLPNEMQCSDPRSSLQLVANVVSNNFCQHQCSSGVDQEAERSVLSYSSVFTDREVILQQYSDALPAHSRNSIASRPSVLRHRSPSGSSAEEGETENATAANSITDDFVLPARSPLLVSGRRLSKKERNKLKNLRRKQKRRERWLQSQLQEQKQTLNSNLTSSDDEDGYGGNKEGYICAVCLDVYFSPYMCYPCHHIFCEPCLRILAKDNPTNTPCPLCRTTITRVFFQTELNNTTKTFFPKEYQSRKQSFQKTSCAKWPLPSCRKLFRVFGGFSRHRDPITRRNFPHGAYRLDTMDFEDDSRGWRFDMDMLTVARAHPLQRILPHVKDGNSNFGIQLLTATPVHRCQWTLISAYLQPHAELPHQGVMGDSTPYWHCISDCGSTERGEGGHIWYKRGDGGTNGSWTWRENCSSPTLKGAELRDTRKVK
nr:PREDICTED: E3 ubiquitin-protein ligase RNF180 isoform X2 [Latimeria chalumnae]|eukprot:XP_014352105.1 PREDICTED: E3 ubiquitin-protein ligase RNF180 isoform X2 [Latimeria chalumnae]